MSRDSLYCFLHAVEHNLELRNKLKRCSDIDSILALAANYGFSITKRDFQMDKESERIEAWFKNSKIPPFRKIQN